MRYSRRSPDARNRYNVHESRRSEYVISVCRYKNRTNKIHLKKPKKILFWPLTPNHMSLEQHDPPTHVCL